MNKLFRRLRTNHALAVALLGVIAACPLAPASASASASPSASAPHSASARLQAYLIASKQQEIVLARSAAPPSVSAHATIMVLGARGYVTAVKGSNTFVCLVSRSWDNVVTVDSATFWNPKTVAPYCFNATGAQSVLPNYLLKTQWVVAGASQAEIGEREKTARAAGKIKDPIPGAICYMLSKHGYGVGGNPGPWRPHIMFYFPTAQQPDWGANLGHNPVYSSSADGLTIFYVLVPVWSDGSPAPSL